MRLSIVIPTKDRGKILDDTLRAAIEATEHVGAEIVVVNDSKSPLSVVPHKRVRLINNLGVGVASARNIGAFQTSGEVLLFLDDDILISRRSIDHIIGLHEEYTNACFNLDWEYPDELKSELRRTQFGRFLQQHNFTSFKGWYNHSSWKDNSLFRSLSVASFHLSIRREAFVKTGGYDERFPFAGFEDHDFPARVKKAGIETYIDTRITVFHNEADRLVLANWLAAQQRRATSRRLAVSLGYQEVAIPYGAGKTVLMRAIARMYPLLVLVLKVIPNSSIFDVIFYRVVSIILAGSIYRGYTARADR